MLNRRQFLGRSLAGLSLPLWNGWVFGAESANGGEAPQWLAERVFGMVFPRPEPGVTVGITPPGFAWLPATDAADYELRIQDDGGRLLCQRQFAGVRAQIATHQGGKLFVHDTDQRLARRETADDLFAKRLFFDLGHELPHHRQGHVGLQQGQSHFAKNFLRIGFGKPGFTAQRFDNARQTVG